MDILLSLSPRVFCEQEGHSGRFLIILPSSLVISQGWGLIDLLLRASDEGLLRPRVARAQKIIRLHPVPSLRWRNMNGM